MLHRHSHREERSVVDRDQPNVARRIQQLAESGDYEGFNAIVGALIKDKEFDETELDVVRRDNDFRNKITDISQEAWVRKHAPRKH
jgi:hypothetical protein